MHDKNVWARANESGDTLKPTGKNELENFVHFRKRSLPARFFGALGPGVVTGAADDDPSGIATYSIAGAQFGTQFLWTAWLTWPLMAYVQMMCARIGMVTGRGLAGNFRKRFPKPVLMGACLALFAANTLNIAADLAGMSDAAELFTKINSHYFVILFAAGISIATLRLRYTQIANTLKWLALILFAYILTAREVHPQWGFVLKEGFTPHLPETSEGWGMLVAILGTTISPYLFFWQASQEVEEEKALGRHSLALRRHATLNELQIRKFDIGIGTFFSNLVMFFIILTTALTLHANGVTHIETSKQAAEALIPLAGKWASGLYAMGLIGTGLLAIPTLTGSAAYALAETMGWRQGLDAKLQKARAFYLTIFASTILAVIFDFANVNPMKMLYWSAVTNGLLAPLLLVGILMVACSKVRMYGQPSSWISRIVVSLVAFVMTFAAVAMFIF
ncbi:MAG: divalent metal cation transporter [Bdellovibrionales bacterium]|nr:divalent metal cation transporter [Oligoflexia bacterium]